MIWPLAGAVLAIALGAAGAAEEPARSVVSVRVGDHAGYGRVVFDLPAGASADVAVDDARLLLVFSGVQDVAPPGVGTRNVNAFKRDGATATLLLVPGATVRTSRMGLRLIVDVYDPPASRDVHAGMPGARTAASGVAGGNGPGKTGKPGRPVPTASTPATAEAMAPPATVPGDDKPGFSGPVRAAEPAAPGTPPGTAPSIDRRLDAPSKEPVMPQGEAAIRPGAPEGHGAGEPAAVPAWAPVLLAADPSVGAAAFIRGRSAVIVLDRRLPIPTPLTLPDATISTGAVTTVLSFTLPEHQYLKLVRLAGGWSVELSPMQQRAELDVAAVPDGLAFPLANGGRSVSTLDPDTGGTLLVGTSLGDGPQAAVAVERRGPEYAILPTVLGVVVEPLSDRETLRLGHNRFVLSKAQPTSLLPASADGRFDLPNEPRSGLLNRMRLQLASAGQAAPRMRTVPRLAEGEAMLALGLGVETQALLDQTVIDDPQAAEDARVPMLRAMAAVAAGRPEDAEALDDVRLKDIPEVVLWRGLRDRRLGRDTPDARTLGVQLHRAWTYPEPLRRLIWPDVAEAAAEAGVPLLAEQSTPYSTALGLERHGDTGAALAAWNALANSPDRLDRVRAARRAIELELASGQIDAAAASERLEPLLVAWRGDGRELETRIRAAELRAAAGQWRPALGLLREAEGTFPESHDEILRRKTAIFGTMLTSSGAAMSAMDVVLMANEFADCVPDDASAARLAALLADKLIALDLSARAIPVLQGLVKATGPGQARAEFGMRLGQLLLEAGDSAGALSALQASATPELDAQSAMKRSLLVARADALQGNVGAAIERLQRLTSPEADDLRAGLLVTAGNWRGASAALADLATKAVPQDGPLDASAQGIVIRQATAASQVPDLPALHVLRQQLPRMTGAQADLLRVLTETPVKSTWELPRASAELALARNIPQQLQAIGRR